MVSLAPCPLALLLAGGAAGVGGAEITVDSRSMSSAGSVSRSSRPQALIAMFLSVAVNRGPQVVQPHQLHMFPAEFKITDVADQVLREDAQFAVRVEASAKMESAPTKLGGGSGVWRRGRGR